MKSAALQPTERGELITGVAHMVTVLRPIMIFSEEIKKELTNGYFLGPLHSAWLDTDGHIYRLICHFISIATPIAETPVILALFDFCYIIRNTYMQQKAARKNHMAILWQLPRNTNKIQSTGVPVQSWKSCYGLADHAAILYSLHEI
jgi:hypothetical protein